MKTLNDLWSLNTDALKVFLRDGPNLNIDSRLAYFRDLFPITEFLPASFYLYDLNNRVIACNGTSLNIMNETNFSNYLDLPVDKYCVIKKWPEPIGQNWIHNNKLAIEAGSVFCEEQTIEGENLKLWASKKEAIYSAKGQPLGIMGITLPLIQKRCRVEKDQQTKHISVHLNSQGLVQFTAREFQVPQCLLKGFSASQIAILYQISPKTVETHIMRIKVKLDCKKQRDILPLLVQENLANELRDFESTF